MPRYTKNIFKFSVQGIIIIRLRLVYICSSFRPIKKCIISQYALRRYIIIIMLWLAWSNCDRISMHFGVSVFVGKEKHDVYICTVVFQQFNARGRAAQIIS